MNIQDDHYISQDAEIMQRKYKMMNFMQILVQNEKYHCKIKRSHEYIFDCFLKTQIVEYNLL